MGEEKEKISRTEELKYLISEAQKNPGIVALMEVYGKYNQFISESEAYLSAFSHQTHPVLSDRSS